MPGTSGWAIIQLFEAIYVDGVTLEHVAPNRRPTSRTIRLLEIVSIHFERIEQIIPKKLHHFSGVRQWKTLRASWERGLQKAITD